MPRFALLHHDCTAVPGMASHWDLMLERGGALMTWRLPALPAPWRRQRSADGSVASYEVEATRLPDHRAAYLDYEGPVGGDRGHVERVDGGEYRVANETAAWLEVELAGAVGTVCLRLMKAGGAADQGA